MDNDGNSIENVVCPFCGCLCDDIEVFLKDGKIISTSNACILGHTKFVESCKGERFTNPFIRRTGKLVETKLETAIEKVLNILDNSDRPLLYGWSSTTCEAIREGILLAEAFGGVIDSTTSVCHGPSILAIQSVGMPSCTLGQIKNRADLIIYWGSNPENSHPRHLSRYSNFCFGRFRDYDDDRELIVVDVRKTDTAKVADKFIQIKPGYDYEVLETLRCIVNGGEIKEDVGGIMKKDIYELAEKMMRCQFGIIFFGLGLTMSQGKHRNVENALLLTRDLNAHTKFSIMPMRGHFNVTGFGTVLTWQTGFPFGVDFSTGSPRYNPGETTAINLIQNEEVDAVLVVASDPVSNFPGRTVQYLAEIPVVTLESKWTPTTEISDVIIPTAITGIECSGTAYRMDGVPIMLKKILDPPDGIYSDLEILQMLNRKRVVY